MKPLLLLLAAATFASAQPHPREYSRRIWRVEDGLPQNRIQAIARTPDGYLWIGTSEGLARFDGVRFTVFGRSTVAAFHDDSILSLKVSRDGSLWIGTEGGGLLHYQAGTFRGYGDREGLTNGFIRAIHEDADGTLWVGADRGLFRKAGDRFERLDGTPEIPLASVVSILRDRGQRLLIASSAGLLTVDQGKLRHVLCAGQPQTSRRPIHLSSDGTLRTFNHAGAQLLRDGCTVPDPAIPAVSLTLLYEDRAGSLWIGTFGHGLFRYRAGRLSQFEAPSVLPDNHITAVFEDVQDNIWVGGSDGLLRLSKTAVTTLGESDGLADDNVTTIYEDRQKALWMATLTGELYRINRGVPERFHLPEASAAASPIRTVYEDSKNAYWFGTAGRGVIRLQNGRILTLTTREGLRSNAVRQILEDPAGGIWIATGSGLSLWEGNRFRNYYLDEGLSYPSVRCLATDRQGDLLVGTDGGLDLIRNRQIVPHPASAQLRKEKIWAIHVDATGATWLGTRGSGLIRFKDGKIARFTTADGLPGNTIYQILEDAQGKFWFSGPLGIFSTARQELDRLADGKAGAIPVVTYGSSEGMATSQMSGGIQPAGALTSNGEIWFPSIKGAVRINPGELPVKRSMPVFIERLVADGRPTPVVGREMRIAPGLGRLAIDFTTCNLAFPQRESFRYRLEGFEETWTQATRVRTATYTNVPPGRYRFRVLATEAGSPSPASEATLTLDFQPALHQTAWFYGLCGLAGIGLVWAAFWLHSRQTSARYALLLAERTRLAREMHDTVIQGCVGVSTLLEASSRFQRTNLEEANNLLGQARAEVKATIDEARQAVWNLRQMNGDDSSIPILFNLARKLGRENAIHTETETIGETVPLDLTTDRTLLLVGREALRNAVAHGRAARITVRLIFSPGEARLEVQDDGVGFDPADACQESGHFGIIGMRERVEQAGGTFAIKSHPGHGTLVAATMPLKGQPARDDSSARLITGRFPAPERLPLPESGHLHSTGSE
jgi:ligand-binding sensor domain-containing protein/signal transduction histidine kinase